MSRRQYWLSEVVEGDEDPPDGFVEYPCSECGEPALIDEEAVRRGLLWECEACGVAQYLEDDEYED